MKSTKLWSVHLSAILAIVSLLAGLSQTLAYREKRETGKKKIWSLAADYYREHAVQEPVKVPGQVSGRAPRPTYFGAKLLEDYPYDSVIAYEIPETDRNDIKRIHRIPDLSELPNLLLQNQKSRYSQQVETFGPDISAPIRAYIANDYVYCDSLNNLTNEGDQTFLHVSKSGFKQYPSHVGLYEKSNPSKYICGASWINDQYLLTAASCMKDKIADDIIAQFNEWNHLSSGHVKASIFTRQPTQPTTITLNRSIETIITFPEYSSSSDNHDLALIELKPLNEFSEATTSILPSCQFNDRRSLHAKSCWIPSRNVTIEEFVDLEELSVRQEKRVNLVNKPVKLIVSDQICRDHTGLASFSSTIPNMLCSTDTTIRQSDKNKDNDLPLDNGSGIYCYEGGFRSLVSIVTPRRKTAASSTLSPGFLDINFYKPWIISITNRYNR